MQHTAAKVGRYDKSVTAGPGRKLRAPSARARSEEIMCRSSSVVRIVCFFLEQWRGLRRRYMFRLSQGWERTFYFLTYVFQGSAYLVPSAHAYMRRAHHAYSDTEKGF
jgi:hypothetical protein